MEKNMQTTVGIPSGFAMQGAHECLEIRDRIRVSDLEFTR